MLGVIKFVLLLLVPALFAALTAFGISDLIVEHWLWLFVPLGSGLVLLALGQADIENFIREHPEPVPLQPAVNFVLSLSGFYLVVPACMAVAYWLSLQGNFAFPRWQTLGAALIAFIVVRWLGSSETDEKVRPDFVRGRELSTYDGAIAQSQRLLATQASGTDRSIFWTDARLPAYAANHHFAVVGATGSGKTVTLRLLMQDVLSPVGRGEDSRALIYDPKADMIPLLSQMGLGCRIETLHPFVQGGVAWDIAKDVPDRNTAKAIAEVLVPPAKESQPYFSNAARVLLEGVINAFNIIAPGEWAFHDLIYAMGDIGRLRQILQVLPDARNLVETYFQPEDTLRSTISTLDTKIGRYDTVAAAWSYAERKISLTDWLDDEYILVLGVDDSIRPAIDPINQAIFKRLSDLVNAGPEVPHDQVRRTWFFFDEVGQAGMLDGMNQLLTKGRSRGACVVLGFQDIEGLREVYGEKLTGELLGQCGSKLILRLESDKTAEWASRQIGSAELYEHPVSEHVDAQGRASHTTGEQLVKREGVLPSQFFTLPLASRANGLTGYCITRQYGVYRANVPDAIQRLRGPDDSHTPGIDLTPRPSEQQALRSWDDDDRERLGLALRHEAQPDRSHTESLNDITRTTRHERSRDKER